MAFDIDDENGEFEVKLIDDEGNEKGVKKYLIYFCYEWMDMESCIQFYTEVDAEFEYTHSELVSMIIHENDGIAEMADGSVVNLMQFVQSYVYPQESDFDPEKQDEDDNKEKPLKLVIR